MFSRAPPCSTAASCRWEFGSVNRGPGMVLDYGIGELSSGPGRGISTSCRPGGTFLGLPTTGPEGARLGRRHGQLGFVRMKELLDRFLPKPRARIIDVGGGTVGGGTGVCSSWLSSLGHIVHLVDVVPGHVEAASRDRTFTASVGDARALPVLSGSYDVALLLGPLYHLPELADRLQAPGGSARAPGCLRRGGDTTRVE